MQGNKKIILKARNIKKSYKENEVLNIKSFNIYEGVFNFLLGPNGSGKTTLLNILSQVDLEYQGEVIYRGNKINKNKMDVLDIRRKFSVIWQNPYLFNKRVRYNIGLPLQLRGVSTDKINKKVENLAEELSITHLLKKHSGELSGGERQKVSIARSLITEPELLFIDEPNTYLDYESSMFFNNLFTNLVNNGVTVLMVTHDLYQIKNMADYLTVLKDGEITDWGLPQAVSF